MRSQQVVFSHDDLDEMYDRNKSRVFGDLLRSYYDNDSEDWLDWIAPDDKNKLLVDIRNLLTNDEESPLVLISQIQGLIVRSLDNSASTYAEGMEPDHYDKE